MTEELQELDVARRVWVTFQRAGLHLYPAAVKDKDLKDVKYLGNEHRHLFKFKVAIEVWHDDREIEFHQFLNWLESLYNAGTLQLDSKSCEMISDELALQIKEKYSGRDFVIEVSEDGECGSVTTYTSTL